MRAHEFIVETLKRVKGRWALVSKSNPKKVLQYYHGSGHPSKKWVKKVERRVHSFEALTPISFVPAMRKPSQSSGVFVERNIFPDGDLIISKHYAQRENERSLSYSDILAIAKEGVRLQGDKISNITDIDFAIKKRDGGAGIAIKKRERPDGSQFYGLATSYPENLRVGRGQEVFFI